MLNGRGRRAVEWYRKDRIARREAGRIAGHATRFAYLGYAGQDNVGDDAIRDAHVTWTLQGDVVELPVHFVRQTAHRAAARGLRIPALLGGGTLVGRKDWLDRVQTYRTSGLVTSWEMLGAGVEDPDFVGGSRHAGWDDLRSWAQELGYFKSVTVRGPLSQKTLANVGVDAEVVGDPALLYSLRSPAVAPPAAGVVGLSVAVPEDVWGGRPQDVVDALERAAVRLAGEGHRIRLLALHPADVPACEQVARAVGAGDGVEIARPRTPDALHDDVAACSVVIGQRLHAVVLAAAAGVPSLAIEYRPKCLDFQASIGRQDWTLSTRDLRAEDVVDRVQHLLTDRETQSQAVREGVKPLVERLLTVGAQVRGRLLAEVGEGDTSRPPARTLVGGGDR